MINDTTINERLNKINQKQKSNCGVCPLSLFIVSDVSSKKIIQHKNDPTKIKSKMMEPINNRPP